MNKNFKFNFLRFRICLASQLWVLLKLFPVSFNLIVNRNMGELLCSPFHLFQNKLKYFYFIL